MSRFSISAELPAWLKQDKKIWSFCDRDLERQMELVIGLSQKNVTHKTGGPFAAGVFEIKTGKLISLGVNRVEPHCASILHAEIVAITLAQQNVIKKFSLAGKLPLRLVASSQPCIQCYGALFWSGISELIYGASAKDVLKIGFHEGPVPTTWKTLLKKEANIAVTSHVLRNKACEVLDLYKNQGGKIYNGS